MDAKVYEAVATRAGGRCECCKRPFGSGLVTSPQCDHFEGRRNSESEATCWLICASCHRAKTDNNPSAEHFLRAFVKHLCRHVESWDDSYFAALDRAMSRLAVQTAKFGKSQK